jgi:hypothetical protein
MILPLCTAAFFALLILLGLFLHRDYGIPWDESISHNNGVVSLSYVLRGDPSLWTYSDRYYGVLFEIPFAFLQEFSNLSMQELLFVRHLCTFLFFLCGVYAFYCLCLKRWKSRPFALLGASLLVLSPRMFADAFYNSKDIPALVLFTVSIYTLALFLEKPNAGRAIAHALPSAALIAIRLPGIFIPAITVGVMGLLLVVRKSARNQWPKTVALLLLYGSVMVSLTVLFWPFLWRSPVEHFLQAVSDMGRYTTRANLPVLYLGEFLRAFELPWHYLPVWISISTPPVLLLLFLAGVCSVSWRFLRSFLHACRTQLLDGIVLVWFVAPVAAVIALDSIIYDGWRHLFFVYPALVYIALLGLNVLLRFSAKLQRNERRELRMALLVLLCIHFFSVTWFMIKSHPYQNVYFNFFVGNMENARRNFDLDYWGLSFREGLEYIARTDSAATIPIAFLSGSPDTIFILPPDQERRFSVPMREGISPPKYILNNYRFQRYDDLPHDSAIHTVQVYGASILSVFKAP